MTDVAYPHSFSYRFDGLRDSPILIFELGTATAPEQSIDVDAYVDSGATESLFDGGLAMAIGLDLLAGEAREYMSTTGHGVGARLHQVVLRHESLGAFELRVGFSTNPIARNLLGRDFLDLVQLGFREHRQEFYVRTEP